MIGIMAIPIGSVSLTGDSLSLQIGLVDSAGVFTAAEAGDSVRIRVSYASDGTLRHNSVYTTSDPELSVTNEMLVFMDAWADLAGAGGAGQYSVAAIFWDASLDLSTPKYMDIEIGLPTIYADTAGAKVTTDHGSGAYTTATSVAVASIGAGVITATAIADDAIDYATFAGSAPSAWWNEGKTGYSLSQTFPANFADLKIAATTGYVDPGTNTVIVGTNNDKTDYTIATSDSIYALVLPMIYYLGACENCDKVYYPNDGTGNKDSIVVYDASHTKRYKMVFRHSNTTTVLDTATTTVVP